MEKHTEQYTDEQGYWRPANACHRCKKWYVPFQTGIPTDIADEYCWGHQWVVVFQYEYPLRVAGPYNTPEDAEKHCDEQGLVRELTSK